MKPTTIVGSTLVPLMLLASGGAAQTPPRCDASPEAVARDEASLRAAVREALLGLLVPSERDEVPGRGVGAPRGPSERPGDAGRALESVRRVDRTLRGLESRIGIEYVGPGEMAPIPPADELPNQRTRGDSGPGPGTITEWVGVNPATCNQFRMSVPREIGRVIGRRAERVGFGTASEVFEHVAPDFPLWDYTPPDEEEFVSPQKGDFFSACTDTRVRMATLDYPKRTVASFSSDGVGTSCTGTLIGPRHVITAAHCVYKGGNSWHDFLVIPGRDGPFRPFGFAEMGGPGFHWYWVPAPVVGNIANFGSGLDIAILVIPERLGDVTGWMGVAAAPESTLMASYHRNLGYPAQPGSPIGYHPSQQQGGLYGDLNQCNIGAFDDYDAAGWARTAGHSCDSTSGHSGGPLYYWAFDPNSSSSAPLVSSVISGHPAFANDFDCANNPRPYLATRVTGEYFDAVLWFLSWKP